MTSFQNITAAETAFKLHSDFGFNVFPLRPRSKKPIESWKEWQTRKVTEEQIEAWTEQYPGCNWAIACGAISGLIVIDVDGKDSLEWAEKHFPLTPFSVVTGRADGGYHLFYRYPTDPMGIDLVGEISHTFFKEKYGVQIDFQKDGFYIVAPGSIHPDTGARYEAHFSDTWENVPEYRLLGLSCTREGAAANNALQSLDMSGTSVGSFGETGRGNRNNMLTSFAGRLVADGVQPQEVLQQTLAHNIAMCKPPLSDREVRTIVNSCLRMHSKNHVRNATAIVTAEDFDYEVAATPQEKPKKLPMPKLLTSPTGLIYDLQQYICGTHVCTHPAFATIGGIALLSTLLVQKVQTETQLVTNNYYTILGLSGSGKDAPKKAIAHILSLIAPNYLAGMDVASSVGIYSHLATQNLERGIFIFDEFGLFLKDCRNQNSPKAGVAAALTKLFSTPSTPYSMAYADNKKRKLIPWHGLNLLAMSVPNEYFEALNLNATVNGFVARQLIVNVPEYYDVRRPRTTMEVPQQLIDRLQTLASYTTPGEGKPARNEAGNTALFSRPNPVTIVLEPDARDFHEEKSAHYEKLRNEYSLEGKNAHASVVSRAAEHAAKHFPILSCSRDPDAIFTNPVATLEDVQAAWELVEWCTQNTIEGIENNISNTPFEALSQKIMRIIRQYIKRSEAKSKSSSNARIPGAPKTTISKHTPDTPNDMVEKALNKLVTSGELLYVEGYASSPRSKRRMNIFCPKEEWDSLPEEYRPFH